MLNRILVVCTGNICRSPMAEYLLRQRLGEEVSIGSAGIAAVVDSPAHPLSVEVMREHGMDISMHRGRQFTGELLRSADLILVLDESHHKWIHTRYPHAVGRVFKLGRWDHNADVADPIRQPKQVFDVSYDLIESYCTTWAQRLR